MNLQARIEMMIGIPSTVNELACLVNAPRRIVHATLHNLKKAGKAAVITKKYEDSTCRGRACGRYMAVWGTPGFRLTGFIKIPNK